MNKVYFSQGLGLQSLASCDVGVDTRLGVDVVVSVPGLGSCVVGVVVDSPPVEGVVMRIAK